MRRLLILAVLLQAFLAVGCAAPAAPDWVLIESKVGDRSVAVFSYLPLLDGNRGGKIVLLPGESVEFASGSKLTHTEVAAFFDRYVGSSCIYDGNSFQPGFPASALGRPKSSAFEGTDVDGTR